MQSLFCIWECYKLFLTIIIIIIIVIFEWEVMAVFWIQAGIKAPPGNLDYYLKVLSTKPLF